MLCQSVGDTVFPGTVLCANDADGIYSTGAGVFRRPDDGALVASLWGRLAATEKDVAPVVPDGDDLATGGATTAHGVENGARTAGAAADAAASTVELSVVAAGTGPGSDASNYSGDVESMEGRAAGTMVPKQGDLVTCRVTRLTTRHAAVAVLCVGNTALSSSFQAIIRKQDVRALELDQVLIHECFRPGDIVLAKVLSLGDRKSLFLTTAANHLGVVFARSQAGQPMVPVGWTSMQCPQTKTIESRKVANLSAE